MGFNTFSFLLHLLFLPCLRAQNNANVPVGEKTLIAGNRDAQWLSPSRDFAFGFHNTTKNGPFLLAIWYNNIPNRTIIWFANGDNLAPQGSKLELEEYRGLVLRDPRGQELWSSQLSGGISYGLMNNTGNLQLLNQNSEVLWQSFQHPTDTLVPTQIMDLGGILSSRRSETNFSKGKFQFRLAEDGNVMLNPINFPSNFSYEPYYSANTNDSGNIENGSRVIFDELGSLYVLRRNGEKFNLTKPGVARPIDAYYYRATINSDGVFTVSYHLKDSSADSQGWVVSDTIPDNICLHVTHIGSGICGFNSICTLQSDRRPKCICLDGYSPVDATDEHSTCLPDFALGCQEGEDSSREDHYHMIALPSTNFPQGDFERYKPSNYEDCVNFCLKDCQCAVAIFGVESGCWLKKLPLSNGVRYNVASESEGGSTALVKLAKNNTVRIPSVQTPSEKTNTKDQDTTIKIMTILLGSSFFFNIMSVAAICVAFFFKFHKRIRASKTANESNLRSFTYQELIKATENFKNELGRGSCGIVYKGEIEMGQMTALAVKKLDRILQDRDKEFKAEVSIIGRTHHKNLVRLLGYCDEGQHRILVLEFLSSGTLASFLFGELKPSWNQRIQIAIGIARGLLYLHEECSTQIIHCDIKPQNILLDEYYNAKISDFGLAKLLLINQSRTETAVRGTKGYVAPDWFRSKAVTAKVDVYSFGVLLLEIICCRQNVDMGIGNEDLPILTDWAYDCYRYRKLDLLVGEDDEAINDMKRLERFVMVAIWCLQEDPSVRPTMKKAMLMLEGIANVAIPPSPYPSSSFRSS